MSARRFVGCILPALAACQSTSSTAENVAATTTQMANGSAIAATEAGSYQGARAATPRDLVLAGDGSVCAAPEIAQYVSLESKPEGDLFAQASYMPTSSLEPTRSEQQQAANRVQISLSEVSVGSIDRDVHGIVCNANIIVDAPDGQRRFSVIYEIRPSLSDPTDVVIRTRGTDFAEAKQYVRSQIVGEATRIAAARHTANVANGSEQPTDAEQQLNKMFGSDRSSDTNGATTDRGNAQ